MAFWALFLALCRINRQSLVRRLVLCGVLLTAAAGGVGAAVSALFLFVAALCLGQYVLDRNEAGPRTAVDLVLHTALGLALLTALFSVLALLPVNNSRLIAMNGLVGYALAGSKAFATAGVTAYVLGSVLSAMPAALWTAKVGRRRSFMFALLMAVAATVALAAGWFALHRRRGAATAAHTPRAMRRREGRP